MKKVAIAIIVSILWALIIFYLFLPAINFQSGSFYIYVISILCVFSATAFFCDVEFSKLNQINYKVGITKLTKVPFIIIGVIIGFMIIGSLVSAQMFNSDKYKSLLKVDEGDFKRDVVELNYNQIPTLDKDSAVNLGSRKMGTMSDLVSQFEVDDMYTQINYNSRPTRVTPLRYGGFIKWFNNKDKGIPAYLSIDMITQEVGLTRLENGMKYTTSDYFNRNINRYLRFKYPTYIFDIVFFEIDDSGNPYWVAPIISKTIGLFGGTDIQGVILTNAVTGECQHFTVNEVPAWVDRVYNAELLIEQYDFLGKFVKGYWNSIFGQRDTRMTTEGYNYLAINDSVYVYTGVTSLGKDESNIGFLLMNQRTKVSTFYPVAGAEEYSAMSSAEGQVQNLNYKATFPLLLNISGEPTYFIPLKDNAGLVKKYAMVNVAQYQCVGIGDTIKDCQSEYLKTINSANKGKAESSVEKVTGTIKEIRNAVIDGNTNYFIKLNESDKQFVISAKSDKAATLLNIGDKIEVEYFKTDNTIIEINKFTLINQ